MEIEVLKALADENRLAILRLLADREWCVCELASELDLSDALVSHHLSRLEEAGIIATSKKGRRRCCRLKQDRLDDLAAQVAEAARAASTAGERAR